MCGDQPIEDLFDAIRKQAQPLVYPAYPLTHVLLPQNFVHKQ